MILALDVESPGLGCYKTQLSLYGFELFNYRNQATKSFNQPNLRNTLCYSIAQILDLHSAIAIHSTTMKPRKPASTVASKIAHCQCKICTDGVREAGWFDPWEKYHTEIVIPLLTKPHWHFDTYCKGCDGLIFKNQDSCLNCRDFYTPLEEKKRWVPSTWCPRCTGRPARRHEG